MCHSLVFFVFYSWSGYNLNLSLISTYSLPIIFGIFSISQTFDYWIVSIILGNRIPESVVIVTTIWLLIHSSKSEDIVADLHIWLLNSNAYILGHVIQTNHLMRVWKMLADWLIHFIDLPYVPLFWGCIFFLTYMALSFSCWVGLCEMTYKIWTFCMI